MNNHQNSWNWLVISPNSKSGVYLSIFYVWVGGWKYELRTANKLPHTYPFARPRVKLRNKSNHEHNTLRDGLHKSYSNTFLTQVGCVVLANMFPRLVEKRNSSWNKVIFPISHLNNSEFWKFFSRKSIVHFILLKWHSQITQWHIIPHQGIAKSCLHLLLKRFMWSFG
jgi:hypothetical protein